MNKRMQPTTHRTPIAATMLTLFFLAGCGTAETGQENGVASDDGRSDVVADAETTGAFEAEITGAQNASISGTATFAFGAGEISLNLQSEDENHVVQIRSSPLFDSRPAEGTYHLGQADQSEPEWDITVVDREPDAGNQGGLYAAREGSVTFASVTAQQIEGEFEIVASSPFTEDEVEVSGTFSAICNTLSGPGGQCF